MKFIFNQIIIDRPKNNIHCISKKNNIIIDCELKNKKLQWVMKHIDTSTQIFDTSAYTTSEENGQQNMMNDNSSKEEMPEIHIIETNDLSDITNIIKDEIKKYMNNGNKDGE
jgi:4-diphosphocytidyl-2C-methyl-D-erythritol kinase